MSKPLIFICYCREDGEWLHRLHPFIKIALGEVELFTDQDIEPGERWETRIREQIERADIAILLLSIDALTSDFIWRVEIPLFQHFQRERGLRIIPILLRPCPYTQVDWLRDLQVWPADGRALAGRENIEEEMTNIALRLVKLVEPGPGLRAVPPRTDRPYLEPPYAGPKELHPIVDPARNLRAAVPFDRTHSAPSWPGTSESTLVQQLFTER